MRGNLGRRLLYQVHDYLSFNFIQDPAMFGYEIEVSVIHVVNNVREEVGT